MDHKNRIEKLAWRQKKEFNESLEELFKKLGITERNYGDFVLDYTPNNPTIEKSSDGYKYKFSRTYRLRPKTEEEKQEEKEIDKNWWYLRCQQANNGGA